MPTRPIAGVLNRKLPEQEECPICLDSLSKKPDGPDYTFSVVRAHAVQHGTASHGFEQHSTGGEGDGVQHAAGSKDAHQGHLFHTNCIVQAFGSQGSRVRGTDDQFQMNCPSCRTRIMLSDLEPLVSEDERVDLDKVSTFDHEVQSKVAQHVDGRVVAAAQPVASPPRAGFPRRDWGFIESRPIVFPGGAAPIGRGFDWGRTQSDEFRMSTGPRIRRERTLSWVEEHELNALRRNMALDIAMSTVCIGAGVMLAAAHAPLITVALVSLSWTPNPLARAMVRGFCPQDY